MRLNNKPLCGGSIISATRGLTARHCTGGDPNPSFFSILAGSTTQSGDANAQIRILSKVLAHPLGDLIELHHDISIIYWTQPLTFGTTVRSIALPAANAKVPYGQKATASGWGALSYPNGTSPEVLQAVSLPLVNNERCSRSYPGKISPDMVCAGGLLIGISSWTEPCAVKGYPTVFARVAYFIDWINENIE